MYLMYQLILDYPKKILYNLGRMDYIRYILTYVVIKISILIIIIIPI